MFKEAKMKKISLFLLMIFGIFMLFATDAATETSQENAVAPETVAEQAQPVENAPESVENAPEPAETAQEPAETSPETSQEPAENTMEPVETVQEPAEPEPETSKEKQHKVKYYRPYEGVGIPLVVLGSLSVVVLMPAMSFMAFAASDACEGVDWGDWFKDLHNGNKKNHTAWTTGAVLTGVLGAGMIVTGSWLISIKKPREDQFVKLNSVALVPTKEGMFASVGFAF